MLRDRAKITEKISLFKKTEHQSDYLHSHKNIMNK